MKHIAPSELMKKPAVPSVFSYQRHLFNEPFVANVLGLHWPHPDPKCMPPGRRVYDGLCGSVVAWEAGDLVHWTVINRPDRVPHLYAAMRHHLHRLGMIVADLEKEFEVQDPRTHHW